jgi:hypothetical protein
LPVTPGLVPGAREHEPDEADIDATISLSVFPHPRDKPGGDGKIDEPRFDTALSVKPHPFDAEGS